MKINQLWSLLKTNVFPAFLAASTLAIGLVLTGCSDKPDSKKPETPQEPQTPPVVDNNKDTELTDAIATLNKFMSTAKEGNNFTIVWEYANNQTSTYYADVDKIKIKNNETITYIVAEEDTLYKVFQAEDTQWHKDLADEGAKDANDTITSFISKVNAISWSEYDSGTKTLKYELNSESATAKPDTDKIMVNVIATDGAETFILKDVGTTTVTLPENITDDTQQVTPPPELTEEQKQTIMVQNIYRAIEGKIRTYIGDSSVINKIYAFDYVNTIDQDNLYSIIQYTTSSGSNRIRLFELPMNTKLTKENILSGNIVSSQNNMTALFTVDAALLQTANDEKSLNIFEKLKSDNLISTTNPDICFYSTITDGTDSTLHAGVHAVKVYTLNSRCIEYSNYRVKSDGGTLDHVTDYLINGTLNETFRQTEIFYHEFTENVIYDLNGLNYLSEE